MRYTSMISFLVAGGISLAVTPLIRRFAIRRGWVSHSTDAQGSAPALLGGAGVLGAVGGALLVSHGAASIRSLLPFWVALLVMFSMGLWDDLMVLSPRVKLAAQAIAASLFLGLSAAQGTLPLNAWTPVFFLWIVGITNALNLLDNMDGLTPGVGAIAAAGLAALMGGRPAGGWLFPSSVSSPPAVVLLALSGALLGFLVYNFSPARIFLGDAGSHLVGFSLAALPLLWLSSKTSSPGLSWGGLLAIPLVLLVPILDTTYVTFSRLARGSSIFQGGKDHLSHRLHQAGLPVAAVALVFYAAGVGCGLAALWISRV